MPLYFFFPACTAVPASSGTKPPETLSWRVLPDGQRQYTAYIVDSQRHPGEQLRDVPTPDNPEGDYLYSYSYYVSMQLTISWAVPILQGFLPRTPQNDMICLEDGTINEDFVTYALFMQLLFPPIHNIETFFRHCTKGIWIHGEHEFWKDFLDEHQQWRHKVNEIARTKRECAIPLSSDWWTIRACDVMRNYDLASCPPRHIADHSPPESIFADLTFAEPVHPEPEDEVDTIMQTYKLISININM